MTASSSASWSRLGPYSNFVNGHVSTMWFTVCCWQECYFPQNRIPRSIDAIPRSRSRVKTLDIARVRDWSRRRCEGGGRKDHRLAPGYRKATGPRRMRPDNRPTLRVVGTFDVCSNAAVNSDLSCFLQRQTEAATFALPGRCSGVTTVISACPAAETSATTVPYRLDTPLPFVSWRSSVRQVCGPWPR